MRDQVVRTDTARVVATAFAGTSRFELLRLLGTGGMGIVYAAYDREARCEVALKLLPTLGPIAAVRMKREFRVVSGAHHPNLVSLGELIEEDGNLFFTMELVTGVDWLSYVRGLDSIARPNVHRSGTHLQSNTASLSALDSSEGGSLSLGGDAAGDDLLRADPTRLASALQQLTQGLAYLHRLGKVHRDVKPSNVLVTKGGRVVILDFGLAVDVARLSGDAPRAGTALYMSPEQAVGAALTPASDWYSVGALLYEALTGRLPFSGNRSEVLAAKQVRDPDPPEAIAADVPRPMNDLCIALLARDPDRRASSADVLAVVSRHSPRATEAIGLRPEFSHFVGRDDVLAAMTRALEDTESEPLAFVIEGESGVGKTALMGEFRRLLEERAFPALVCCGRCSERESVPFKALDGIAEGLAEQWASILDDAAHDARSVAVAAEAAGLAFPVLNRGVEPNTLAGSVAWDPWLKQRLAFQGVRDLLASVASRRRVVLCIDDWQWVDADSIRMLSHVLAAPAPRLLLVLATRPGAAPVPLPCAQRRVSLNNLEPESAERLARRLLDGLVLPQAAPLARAIATESLGHPLFIAALARQVVAGEKPTANRPDLDAAIGSRIEALPEIARAAAELVAVFGGPLPRAVLQSALASRQATISWQELTSSIARLTLENLARANGVRASDTIDCFHSRVAAAILARLPRARRRERHRSLALALEAHDSLDYESMTEHWAEAGDPERAASYALRAAEGAEAKLAFERAARFYRRSLALCPRQRDRASVQRRLAAALGHMGRGREAADTYLEAAAAASAEQKIELHRQAADQLFRSGYVDDAVRLIEHVFPSHGLLFPKTSRMALLWLALRRMVVRLRGIAFTPRPAASISPSELARIDAAWTVAVGLSTVDNLKGACVQSGNLLLALRLGEPFRVVRAIAAEAPYVGTAGARSKPRVDKLLARATALARDLGDPYAHGFVHLARCFALYMRSDFEAARRAGEDAESVFERRPVMASWELASARMLSISAHFYEGRLDVVRRRVPALVQEAQGRGDVYAATCLRLGVCNSAWLVDDQSAEARRQLRIASESWHYEGVHLQHCWDLLAWVHVDLYEGHAEEAYSRLQRPWRAIERSFVMRFERLRAELFWLRARAALAYAAHPGSGHALRGRLLGEADAWNARLLRESAPWAAGAGNAVAAGIHAVRGERRQARDRLRCAMGAAEACGMHILLRAYGEWLGDPARGLVGVARPDRWIRMMMPGLKELEPRDF